MLLLVFLSTHLRAVFILKETLSWEPATGESGGEDNPELDMVLGG